MSPRQGVAPSAARGFTPGMALCAWVVAALLPLPAAAQAHKHAGHGAPASGQVTPSNTPHSHQHSFADAEKWAGVFDDPARDAWQKPHEVIQALKLPPGAVVADIGAGTGYFAVRLAHMLGKGRVYAVDSEPGMVKHVAERAKKAKLRNLDAVLARADDPRLPSPADLVLLVDVYHHIEGREAYFRRLQELLKPGGRIAIIDFNEASPVGPPKSARIYAPQVKAEMARAGYTLSEEHGFLPNQFFLVFSVAR